MPSPSGPPPPRLEEPVRGTYLLVVRLPADVCLEVGRLGTFRFPQGWYAYVGSALGPGGLRARLSRHQRAKKQLHWHIDYLLQCGTVDSIWQTTWPSRLECAWAGALHQCPDTSTPAPGFGSSDCRCPAHLVSFQHEPAESAIADILKRVTPAEQPPTKSWSLSWTSPVDPS